MMKRNLVCAVLFGGLAIVTVATPAWADACAAVKREMAYGKAAAEDAKDKAGFALAAKEFNAAASKAPDCANAFRSLGIVQEGAGNLAAAKAAYERYLKLAPSSADVAAVEEQIFKLEYRIKRAGQTKHAAKTQKQDARRLLKDARRLLKDVVGTWDRQCANPSQNAPNWEFAVDRDFVKWRFFHHELGGLSGFSNGKKYNFKTNQFEMIRGVLVEVKSKELLEVPGVRFVHTDDINGKANARRGYRSVDGKI